MSHTQTPWTYHKTGYIRKDDLYIAEVLSGPDSPDVEEVKANAAYIVQAVNAHEALVACCERALKDSARVFPDFADQLRAALALAKKEN